MPNDAAASSTSLAGLNPAGLFLGALGEASASWPQDGPVTWQPPEATEAEALFPGYAEVRFLGRGGMGAVYAARQISLERKVAIKLLPAELSRNPAAAERFRREARALAMLSHPNIVAVHDFGETPGGSFFFVMEHVDGADVHQLIRDGGIALPQVLDIVRQVCDALEYAHAQGFVHRDIKPANILVDTAGRVKVSDFGLARIVGESEAAPPHEPAPTMTGGIVGTPEYIAPEQRAGDRPVDHRADLYSLGVMLYEMLTGSVPRGAFEPPSRRADVDQQMDRVVLRAMQEEPDKRYQHAAEVKSDVNRVARRAPQRWWSRAAVAAVFACLAAGSWHLLAGNRTAPGSPSPDHASAPVKTWRNSRGMTFLAGGTPGVLVAATEVSRGDFASFARATGHLASGTVHYPKDGAWISEDGTWESPPGLPPQTEEHAAVAVTPADAAAFCVWLTAEHQKTGELTAGQRYRLPTAEEWARAAGLPLLISREDRQPADALPGGLIMAAAPDNRGFRALHGGVVEWTSSPGTAENEFLAMGTGWADPAPSPDAALARSYHAELRGSVLGFRIVLETGAPGP